MAEPVVFISHFRVIDGAHDRLREHANSVTALLERTKPQTIAYVGYLDESATRLTIVHVFVDADAMDTHFQGAAERTVAALEFIEPLGWEIYGQPSASALNVVRLSAEAAGVELTVQPQYLFGFLRSSSVA